jgi:pimeloyl-ACP methyl ester carboxylesterase
MAYLRNQTAVSTPRRGTVSLSRSVAIFLAPVIVCVAALVNTALTAEQAAAAPASIYCSTDHEARQPVLLVHGFNSGPQTWQDASRNQLARAGSSTCIDVFDYAEQSSNWVTDLKTGPALATRIGTLAAASKAGGGSGKVIIVAHSMGGLATRCASSTICNGGQDGIAPLIAELISFGTPNTGSWLVGPGLHDVGRTLGSLFSAACYLSFNGANDICQQIRNLGTSDATRAFKPDSKQLQDLPQLPSDVPVYALAAQIEIHTSFFGLNEADLGDGGDAIVLEDSAQVPARTIDGIGGSQTINCGKIDITDLARSADSCWHSTETNDTRFLEAAAHQIALVEDKLNSCSPQAVTIDDQGFQLPLSLGAIVNQTCAAMKKGDLSTIQRLYAGQGSYSWASVSPHLTKAARDALVMAMQARPFHTDGYNYSHGGYSIGFGGENSPPNKILIINGPWPSAIASPPPSTTGPTSGGRYPTNASDPYGCIAWESSGDPYADDPCEIHYSDNAHSDIAEPINAPRLWELCVHSRAATMRDTPLVYQKYCK